MSRLSGSASISASDPSYDTVAQSREIFARLLQDPKLDIPSEIKSLAGQVDVHGVGGYPTIPSPWRETEAITAVKAVEAATVLALAKLRYPSSPPQTAQVDTDHATIFLFLSYLSTINGYGKWDPQSLAHLKPTDIHQAQSNLYRRLSANIYETTRPGEYYHTHGSLQATTILTALGLPAFLKEGGCELEALEGDYDKICELIQARTKTYTADELDQMTMDLKQAGAPVYKEEDFLNTEHGNALSQEPVISVEKVERVSSPASFPSISDGCPEDTKPHLLQGIKVLDLTRVIAGPSIARTLAEYGASVLKVTSPNLPDVPWYAVDLNFGKRTCDLDLRNSNDRATFEALLDHDGGVDVIVDGYRPGSLDRLGYGFEDMKKRWQNRGKGFVYVRESCFGHVGPWKERSGWQPIADAVSGIAWGHGVAMGLNQPVLPPFPMSDYGTGALGSTGALLALYQRAAHGGSYVVDVSLTGWNLWLQSLGQYPQEVWQEVLKKHRPEIEEFKIGHLSNFDVVSKASIQSMKRLSPRLFDDKYLFEMDSPGFRAIVKSIRPVVEYSGLSTGFANEPHRASRPNGFDQPTWT